MTLKEVGAIIKTMRKLARLSQAELAEKVGVSRVTISNWEGGKHDVQLARIFQVSEACGTKIRLKFEEVALL